MFPLLFLASIGLGKKIFTFYSSKILFEDICLIMFCAIVIASELLVSSGSFHDLGRPVLFLSRFLIPFYVLSFCFRNTIAPSYAFILCIVILFSICLPLVLNYEEIKNLGETERLFFSGIGNSATAAGTFATGSFLFTIYVFLLSGKKNTPYYKTLIITMLLIFGVTVWMLFKLKTRGSWLYIFTTFLVYVLFRKEVVNEVNTKMNHPLLKAALFCVVVSVFICWDLICQIDFYQVSPEKIINDFLEMQRFSEKSFEYDQTYGRLYIWEQYLNYFSSSNNFFIGSGFPDLGDSIAANFDNSIRGLAPHNAILGIWMLYGFFGLFFYFLFHISILYRAYKSLREDRSKKTVFAFSILVGGIVPFLTENYFFLNANILPWMWYILGGIFVNKDRLSS